MCGIAGIYNFSDKLIDTSLLKDMIKSIEHRGPDSLGFWSDEGTSLGHARLSINDLSDAGKQPMLSASQRWELVFNGEIYNYRAIKQELQKSSLLDFKGSSDTEVLVNAIDIWGIERALKNALVCLPLRLSTKKQNSLSLQETGLGRNQYIMDCKITFLFLHQS